MTEYCYVCGVAFPPLPPGKIDHEDSVRALIKRPTGKQESVYAHYECAKQAFDNLRRDLDLPTDVALRDRTVYQAFQDMTKALDAVLIFHSGTEWDASRRAAWKRCTGSDEATTKVLCDTVRRALGEEKTDVPDPQKEP